MKVIKKDILYSFNLNYNKTQLNRMTTHVLSNTTLLKNHKSYNFLVPKNKDFEGLYKDFYNTVFKFFRFTPRVSNKTGHNLCWAFVSNKDYTPERWHNHIETSTINGVYYLKVNKDEQGIQFKLDNKIFTYIPKVNECIVFPNWLNHFPISSKTDHRISINMEILCNESANQIFATKYI
jgi:hypothetical protein